MLLICLLSHAQSFFSVLVPTDVFATGQLRSYMRTPPIYYAAQLMTLDGTPCCVMGTGNADEDGYLAYL
jgi:NAD+ synthase (glutamine-hydrolysing)